MLNLQGPIVALLTPFNANGEIDWQAFDSYLSSLYSWGVRAVITNGSTGEFASLTLKERIQIVEFVRNHFTGVIINNVSATCHDDVNYLITTSISFADYILLLPPYYYSGCEEKGLCRFFIDALSSNELPVLLYNFPQHTGNYLTVSLVAELQNHVYGINGIKDSSGDINNAISYKCNFPELNVYLGNDAKILEVLQKGLTGSVTGGANPLPELLIAIQKDFTSNGNQGEPLQNIIYTWNRFREEHGYFEIPLVKAAMGLRVQGFPIYVRAPFSSVKPDAVNSVRNVLRHCLQDYKQLLEN